MKLYLTTILFIAVLLSVTSCSTSTKTCGADYDQVKITKQGIIQKPIVTDLVVDKDKKTLTKSYTYTSIFAAKESVMADFVKENKCDIIINPMFTYCLETNNSSQTISITVSGFAGMYKNFRNFEASDTANLLPRKLNMLQPDKYVSSSLDIINIPAKNKKPLALIGVIATALLILLLVK